MRGVTRKFSYSLADLATLTDSILESAWNKLGESFRKKNVKAWKRGMKRPKRTRLERK